MKKGEYSEEAQYEELSDHRSFEALGRRPRDRGAPALSASLLGEPHSGEPEAWCVGQVGLPQQSSTGGAAATADVSFLTAWGWKSGVQLSQGLVLPEAPLLGF